jgi:SAM-dependent methyltransferase
MGITTPYSSTMEYIRFRWPSYLVGYGGLLAVLLFCLFFSLNQGWTGLAYLAFACLLVVSYFLIASLWAVHRLFDGDSMIEETFRYGNLTSDARIVFIDLGLKKIPAVVARRLIRGRVTVIDVYNPQLAPSSWLSRAVRQIRRPVGDPRLEWKSGNIDLLPLPDSSVPTVMLVMTALEFSQEGDRVQLLKEITRLLTPDGSLILVERARTLTNWLVLGPAASRLPAADYWRSLLSKCGYDVVKDEVHRDLAFIFVARQSSRLLSNHQLSLFKT